MIKVGIIGATGYAGAELTRILLSHPDVEIVSLVSKSYAGERFSEIYGNLYSVWDEECSAEELGDLSVKCDVVFTATPQGFLSSRLDDEILSQTKIIDLSADYRISDVSVYEQWYGLKHGSPGLIDKAVYGLCEIHRDKIIASDLIANPGCYTTCSILTLYPLAKDGLIDNSTIIIDAKSGVSGAGRGAKVSNLFCEVNESCKAYGVASHRHTPEIEEQLSLAAGEQIVLNFTPHLIPMNRGILVSAYANILDGVTPEMIADSYSKYYGEEHFIRLLGPGVCPETRWVRGSNFVDIGWVFDERTNRIIAMGALDNLIKGAAGQAVQNMNIIFGLEEAAGLEMLPVF